MGSEWAQYTLGDLGRIVTGKTPLKSVEGNFGNEIPFVTPRDLDGTRIVKRTERFLSEQGAQSVKNARIPANSVLVSCIGSDMGKAALIKEESVTNQQINAIIVDPKFDYSYVYYVLSTRKQEIRDAAGGSAQPILNKTHFSQLDITLPPLPEQKAIAHILGSLDDKIELNRRMNETLEGISRDLFKSWFVDFDPVIDNALEAGNPIPDEFAKRAEVRRAVLGEGSSRSLNRSKKGIEQELDTPNKTHAKKSAAGATHSQYHNLFPAAFQETEEMGWIPEGWEVSTIGEEVDSVGGGTPSTKNELFWNGVHPFCTPKDMSKLSSLVLSDTERHLTDLGAQKVSSGILPKGTLLMSSRAPIGYLAIAEMPVTVNQGVIALLKNETYQPMFLLSWLRSNMERIVERANGSTFLEISKKNFKPIPFLKPSGDAVSLLNSQTDSIHRKIVVNVNNTNQLISLRDTLLPKLISGELRIKDAEKLGTKT